MKIISHVFLLGAVLLMVVGLVYAGHYHLVSTIVDSTTVPVQIIPGGQKDSWSFRPRAAATTLLCFPVATNAASPSAVPSPANVQEVPAGLQLYDQLSGYNGVQDQTVFQDSIWCVEAATPVATVTVDGWYR